MTTNERTVPTRPEASGHGECGNGDGVSSGSQIWVDRHQGDLDAFVADQVMAMKKCGGADKAAVFESGYREGELKCLYRAD